MIQYTITIEELQGGNFRVKMESPPERSATQKERMFAEHFSAHNKAIFKEIAKQCGGSFVFDN